MSSYISHIKCLTDVFIILTVFLQRPPVKEANEKITINKQLEKSQIQISLQLQTSVLKSNEYIPDILNTYLFCRDTALPLIKSRKNITLTFKYIEINIYDYSSYNAKYNMKCAKLKHITGFIIYILTS